jgi:hypothetical protein
VALLAPVLITIARDAAKDLGILNVTNALPQTVAPASRARCTTVVMQ